MLFFPALAALACSRAPQGVQTPVRWTATAPAVAAAPGGTASVGVRAAIDNGWHIYAIDQDPGGPVPTRITLGDGQPFTLASAVSTITPPHTEMDESFHINVRMHDRDAGFTVPIKVDSSARPGGDTVHVNARYQVCNASLCLPPQTARLTVPVRIAGGK